MQLQAQRHVQGLLSLERAQLQAVGASLGPSCAANCCGLIPMEERAAPGTLIDLCTRTLSLHIPATACAVLAGSLQPGCCQA